MKIRDSLHWLLAIIIAGIVILAIVAPVTFPTITIGQRIALALSGLGIAGLFIESAHWLTRQTARTQQWLLIGIVIAIGLLQLAVAICFVDAGEADSFIVKNQAVALTSHLTTHWNSYFQVYSNNNNLVLLQTALLKIGNFFGLKTPWVLLNLLRFMWLDTALWAGLSILKTWHRNALRPLFAGMWLLTIPLYCFGLFLYSDSLVIPIPIVTLALWQLSRQHTGWKRYSLAGLLIVELVFGVLIKPNMIVMVIAFIGLMGIGWLHRKISFKTAVTLSLTCLLALGGGLYGSKIMAKQAGYQPNANLALPATSWIAMSWNPATNGEYTFQNAYQERLLPTKQAKDVHAKTLLEHRLTKLGPTGTVTHLVKKSDAFLSSGTFGGFNLTNQWQRAPHWYLANQDAIGYHLTVLSQVMYVGLLLLVLLFFTALPVNWENGFLSLSLLGLMSFHIIFWEVEPRYALPLLPILLLWGVLGTQRLPVPATLQNRKLGRYAVPFITGISLILGGIGLTRFQTTTHTRIVAEQADGKYYNNDRYRLKPGASVTSRIRVTVPSSAIVLQFNRHSQTTVAVTLYRNGHRVAHITGPANLSDYLRYKRVANGRFTVKITNVGHQNTSLGVARSAFPVNQNPLVGHQNLYLRYHVLLRHTEQD
ncbi:hypothetical protein [Secundilactobacillus paracollinoides]|uniref:Glycosyltransferase RgtA/B/C/D-like domain-containing protein n=1 Tax=Secundilactobacillus paracollinoides TaxID=240427 RepID=A0A1B2IVZ0_9LACO|nr:hypothetical protein [Secundilactobacillus paracollinoides]ANZ60384.1 hypothetical protein AYR61_02810 [Secundilactobacillus paracollinoides]ANZ66213.1 hypothetical protein AYR63_03015 [Secundilactobacillus paracollinoides]